MVYLHVKLVNHLLDLDDKERTSKVLQNVMLKSVHLDVMTPLVTQRPIWSVRHLTYAWRRKHCGSGGSHFHRTIQRKLDSMDLFTRYSEFSVFSVMVSIQYQNQSMQCSRQLTLHQIFGSYCYQIRWRLVRFDNDKHKNCVFMYYVLRQPIQIQPFFGQKSIRIWV